ncbi:Cytochrome C [Methylacidimicrobium sp. AP8]|uniref:c-type cytochrome n=1 Tax=Methylacidimicrobium sp. AP8 TaxID=2730359 RepID=UPI0018C0F420|nr:cytochrome c [Methylacidimicrobium sp. AP8]CAB4244387.1 Cytochrome C [Methylacidimicrobium sp. AP8]
MNHESDPQKLPPTDSPRERIPCSFIVFASWIILLAIAYFLRYNGGFRCDVYDASGLLAGWTPTAPGSAARTANAPGGEEPKPAAVDPVALGREQYQANCAACHQPNGQGMTGQFPPVAGSEWVDGDARVLAAIVLGGLQGPVKVAGAEYNGMMPAWKTVLTDEKIAAILTFLRQSWGNHASPVGEQEVKAVRAQLGGHSGPWKVEELRDLSAGKAEKKGP